MIERTLLQDLSWCLGKLTFDGLVNGLERYWKGDRSYTITKPGSFSKIKGH